MGIWYILSNHLVRNVTYIYKYIWYTILKTIYTQKCAELVLQVWEVSTNIFPIYEFWIVFRFSLINSYARAILQYRLNSIIGHLCKLWHLVWCGMVKLWWSILKPLCPVSLVCHIVPGTLSVRIVSCMACNCKSQNPVSLVRHIVSHCTTCHRNWEMQLRAI